MQLGAFSVSLAVADIDASLDFYQKMGFEIVGGDRKQNWLILRNGDHTIGLFEGMFDRNVLTFNPGWDKFGNQLQSFTDVRELQRQFAANGLELASEADAGGSGPDSFVVIDPDGNPVLIDQHV